jgi:hypothetical protein
VSAPVAVRDVVSRAFQRVRDSDLQKFELVHFYCRSWRAQCPGARQGESPRPERTEPGELSRLGAGLPLHSGGATRGHPLHEVALSGTSRQAFASFSRRLDLDTHTGNR